ncbi:lipopolysaccharide biosynthesis protein [Desulfuromonas sp. KJ2020]|uniref:lipopolysaccharide biosynthesis protein n=1 Tax=Desulfuromonas sp. KJ2020 TaxID=2919173 RepID=UPI0020A6F798|nr:lipopolysaccharide biosynthesis protein [Desulfuromonas sp. KJ2020]MCP3178139.1 lipopolysaccharide biosynthesis protein [Desulfuromonas sp. KJ2020]
MHPFTNQYFNSFWILDLIMRLRSQVLSGLRWTAGARFSAQIITWAITLYIIRLLSPADYGLMELALVFVAFLTLLNELGLGAAVVQHKNLDHNSLRSLFGLVLFVSTLFYTLLTILAPVIANFYEEPRLTSLIRVLSLQFLLMGFTVLPQSLLLRDMAFRKIASVDFVSAISGSIVTLTLAVAGFGVWSLVWGSLAIRVVSLVGLNLVRPFVHIPCLKMAGMGDFISFGGYVTLSRVLWYFYSRADVLIIGKIFGKELLGFYAVGLYLASLPMEKISGILNQVAFPAFASVQSDPELAGRHFLKAIRVLSFFAFPVLWGISSIAPEIVNLFLGIKWADAALPLQVIALVIPLRMVSNLFNPALLGAGRADFSFENSLVAFLVMPIAFWIGSNWGLLGVSMAWVIAFPLVFCVNLLRVKRVLAIAVSDVLKALRMPFLSGFIMYCGVLLVKRTPVMSIHMVPKFVVYIGSGVVIYLLMSLIFNRNGLNEIRAIAKT